jgi:hypothetical protein
MTIRGPGPMEIGEEGLVAVNVPTAACANGEQHTRAGGLISEPQAWKPPTVTRSVSAITESSPALALT